MNVAETLDYEQVGMPVSSVVPVMLGRAAAAVRRRVLHSVVVANSEAALRVVRGHLAFPLVPLVVAEAYREVYGLRCITLDEPGAQRRFAICFRGGDSLSAAARLLIEHLRRDQ